MIRILKKDEKAADHASDLVGKFVGKEGAMIARTYGRPMLVTEYSGSRLYGVEAVRAKGATTEDYRLLPTEEWTSSTRLNTAQIAYVCDTIEECEALMMASFHALHVYGEGQKKLKAMVDSIYEEAVERAAANTGAVPPKP